MMMMASAAKRQLTLAGINLWQTGIRSLFNFYCYRSELERDAAWANVRTEMQRVFDENNHQPEEWEFQLVRAILYEEKNCTLEEAEDFYTLYPDSTPLIDALKACILNWRKQD